MTDVIGPRLARIDQQQLARELVDAARAEGVKLVGPGGLLTGLTKTVLETALEAELSEHLGYDKRRAFFLVGAEPVPVDLADGGTPVTVWRLDAATGRLDRPS